MKPIRKKEKEYKNRYNGIGCPYYGMLDFCCDEGIDYEDWYQCNSNVCPYQTNEGKKEEGEDLYAGKIIERPFEEEVEEEK